MSIIEDEYHRAMLNDIVRLGDRPRSPDRDAIRSIVARSLPTGMREAVETDGTSLHIVCEVAATVALHVVAQQRAPAYREFISDHDKADEALVGDARRKLATLRELTRKPVSRSLWWVVLTVYSAIGLLAVAVPSHPTMDADHAWRGVMLLVVLYSWARWDRRHVVR